MRFTPREWRALQKGYELKTKAERRNIAWAVAHLMNVSGNVKKQITAGELLGESPPVEQKQKTSTQDLEALTRRFGGV